MQIGDDTSAGEGRASGPQRSVAVIHCRARLALDLARACRNDQWLRLARLAYPMSPSPQFKQESRALLRLANPIILSQIAQVLMGLVDTVMSGHAGAIEQAVVGLGVALWIPVFIGLMLSLIHI